MRKLVMHVLIALIVFIVGTALAIMFDLGPVVHSAARAL